MRFNFSAEFLRIIPPDTSFADAWESLCYDLLASETNDPSLQHFKAPDRGIDIWHQSASNAYQCKSTERGALGSIPASATIDSLKTAVNLRGVIPWTSYLFATNANYSGDGVKAIMEEGSRLQLATSQLMFRGPEYWSELCEKHYSRVSDKLDYRILVTSEQVIAAFRKARYYDSYVAQFGEKISSSPLVLRVENNLTPVALEVPFSSLLSVQNGLDAVQELLGVSLTWMNYPDLGTSAGPSISIAVGRRPQAFNKTIGDVERERGDKPLTFWITVVCKDKTRSDAADASTTQQFEFLRGRAWHESESLFRTDVPRNSLTESERLNRTFKRTQHLIQRAIWQAVAKLRGGVPPEGAL